MEKIKERETTNKRERGVVIDKMMNKVIYHYLVDIEGEVKEQKKRKEDKRRHNSKKKRTKKKNSKRRRFRSKNIRSKWKN